MSYWDLDGWQIQYFHNTALFFSKENPAYLLFSADIFEYVMSIMKFLVVDIVDPWAYLLSCTVEEEHEILTYNGGMFSLPHFHFQFKSVNISTILTSKLKMCVYFWRLVPWLSLGVYLSWVESSVNKQICLNCVLFLHNGCWIRYWLSQFSVLSVIFIFYNLIFVLRSNDPCHTQSNT